MPDYYPAITNKQFVSSSVTGVILKHSSQGCWREAGGGKGRNGQRLVARDPTLRSS